MASTAIRNLAVATVSALVALAVGWAFLRPADEEPATVELVDTGEAFRRVLEERAARTSARYGGRLVREPIDEEFVRNVLGQKHMAYDPVTYFRLSANMNASQKFSEHPDRGWVVRTNSLGMRDDEPLSEKPDLRVLVTGDSHTQGVCRGDETFANRLEAMLGESHPDRVVEVLNAGVGAYNLYNYLGVLEKHAGLEPDVFVVAVYGGNDFEGALALYLYFTRGKLVGPPRRYSEARKEAMRVARGATAQAANQLLLFKQRPALALHAAEAARQVTDEVARLCEERGIALIFVYIPSAIEVQPELYRGPFEQVGELLDLELEDVAVTTRVADAWLEHVEALSLPALDLRPAFRAESEPLYWHRDWHMNVLAHERIAELLVPLVEEAAGL
ncbi:MAG: SGNH/GDSL hydrolase family protein [Planctomycetota bacterium]|nr:SGNH/GDSL hydrolase family protein [Planctomycetota bacterium]